MRAFDPCVYVRIPRKEIRETPVKQSRETRGPTLLAASRNRFKIARNVFVTVAQYALYFAERVLRNERAAKVPVSGPALRALG